ncbi:hypothetical protein [Sphingosinicella sp.]|uniref:hypothetical protein n=1 Tax=Sphingosinicella sp. TaxID=1917971 RepID=UPI0040382D5D
MGVLADRFHMRAPDDEASARTSVRKISPDITGRHGFSSQRNEDRRRGDDGAASRWNPAIIAPASNGFLRAKMITPGAKEGVFSALV